MPEIGRIELKQQSIGQSLSSLKKELLPADMAKNHLAEWVMEYDELLKTKTQTDGRSEPPYRPDESNLWVWETGGSLTASIVQTHLPFYFTSLFHIAREWKVTESALNDCLLLQEEQNLEASARNIERISSRNLVRGVFISADAALESLQELCELGIAKHKEVLASTRNWWQQWQAEVRSYYEAVNLINQSFEKRNQELLIQSLIQLILAASKPSNLHELMIRKGVRFKFDSQINEKTTDTSLLSYWTILGLVLSASGSSYFSRYSLDRYMQALDRHIWEVRTAPEIGFVYRVLEKKYGDTDPFARFGSAQKAPTEELVLLIKEHTLPSRIDSVWLKAWKDRLGDSVYSYDELPPLGSTPYETILDWAVKSADSTIKLNLTTRLKPAESWIEFLQRLFETRWVYSIGIMLGRSRKASSERWTHSEFHAFVTNVVERLNEIGYSLEPVSSERLQKLLHRAENEEHFYDDAW